MLTSLPFEHATKTGMSPVRRAGLTTLRVYLLLACVLVVVKIVQAGMS